MSTVTVDLGSRTYQIKIEEGILSKVGPLSASLQTGKPAAGTNIQQGRVRWYVASDRQRIQKMFDCNLVEFMKQI